MIAFYAFAVVGVCAALMGLVLEAVASVLRDANRGYCAAFLSAVSTAERRNQALPFVGLDRRELVLIAEQRKRA